MSAKDKYHEAFKTALEKEGWTVMNDPLSLKSGTIPVYIDLEAERIIAAERGNEKIAIEIKSFGGPSFITDLYMAVGKYICYRVILEEKKYDRLLYLAMPNKVYQENEEEPVLKTFKREQIHLILFDEKAKIVKQWIKQKNTNP